MDNWITPPPLIFCAPRRTLASASFLVPFQCHISCAHIVPYFWCPCCVLFLVPILCPCSALFLVPHFCQPRLLGGYRIVYDAHFTRCVHGAVTVQCVHAMCTVLWLSCMHIALERWLSCMRTGWRTLMHALHWIEERGPSPAKGSITFGSFNVICEH